MDDAKLMNGGIISEYNITKPMLRNDSVLNKQQQKDLNGYIGKYISGNKNEIKIEIDGDEIEEVIKKLKGYRIIANPEMINEINKAVKYYDSIKKNPFKLLLYRIKYLFYWLFERICK